MSTPPREQSGSWTVHARRVLIAWIVLSADRDAARLIFCSARVLPPGKSSVQASRAGVRQHGHDVAFVTPIVCLLVVFFVYVADPVPRRAAAELVDGPPLRNDSTVQIVVGRRDVRRRALPRRLRHVRAAPERLRRRPGPGPIARSSGNNLQVQVIAQQWEFTYRYPSLRRARDVAARAAGRHEDRAPRHLARRDRTRSGRYSSASRPTRTRASTTSRTCRRRARGSFHIHCAELCGLWHGYMFDTGEVVPASAVRRLGQAAAAGLRVGREVHAEVRDGLLPRPAEESRMSSMAVEVRPPLWRRLVGFNLLTGIVLGIVGWYAGWYARARDRRRRASTTSPRSTTTSCRSSSPTSSA